MTKLSTSAAGVPPSGLDLESLRTAYLLVNDLGRRLTVTIEQVAGPGVSSNADIATLIALRAGALRPRDLMALTGLSSAGVSSLGDRLEQRSLVHRARSVDDDGRGIAVELTPAGRSLTDRIITAVSDQFDAMRPVRLEIVRALGHPVPRSLTPGSEQVIERLADVGHRGFIAMRVDAFPDDPTPGQTAVVLAMAAAAPTRPRDLIPATGLSSGGVTQLVSRLVDHGLARREPAASGDRRAIAVVATAEGRAALDQSLARFAELADELAGAVI